VHREFCLYSAPSSIRTPTSATSPTTSSSTTSSNNHALPGIIAGSIVGAAIVVMAVIVSYLVIRKRRRRRESIKVSAVQDRFELPPSPLSPLSPDPLKNSKFQRVEKRVVPDQLNSPASDVEPAGPQRMYLEERESEAGRANGHISFASFGRTTLIGESGSEISEGDTHARVHALERAFLSLRASLGMTSNSSEVPPPSYAPGSDG
jgi:hypothetical protein